MKSSVQLLLLVLASGIGRVLGQPEVDTNFGRVRGLWLKTARGAEIAGFLGLPYAEPPIGSLRFEPPVQWTQRWEGTRDATVDGSMCMQNSEMGVIGNEDCLNLNVFTPTIKKDENETESRKFPVMVFIFGGSFNGGSSNSSLFAPTYLLDHEIVLVTLNYRLNALGFLSTGNDVAPGNYGLKDIAEALRWLKQNVHAFGGDPDSVTLAGQSSGAAAAQLLSASPATEGLFHKLITMSGSASAQWAVHNREDIRNSSLHLAELLGCSEEAVTTEVDPGSGDSESELSKEIDDVVNDLSIVECLRLANASDIVQLSASAFSVWRRNPVCIFGPTLEAEDEGAILTVHPVRALSEGLFRDMPWITGVMDDEGLLKTTDLLLMSEIKDEFVLEFDTVLVPYVLEMERKINNVSGATDAIEDFYFSGDVAANLEANVTQMIGDGLIAYSSYDFLQKQVENMKSNVYFYVFSYEGTFSNTFRWGIPFRFGAAHGDDVNYIFPYLNVKHADLQLFNTMADRTMINIMSEMWVSFAKTGVPSARLTAIWEPYQEHRRFMRFGSGRTTERTMESDFLPERMTFWAELVGNFSAPIPEYEVSNEEEEEEEENEGSQGVAAAGRGGGMEVLASTALLWLLTRFFS